MELHIRCTFKGIVKVEDLAKEIQNWNCISDVYSRASRCAAMALFMGGGPHLRICILKYQNKLLSTVTESGTFFSITNVTAQIYNMLNRLQIETNVNSQVFYPNIRGRCRAVSLNHLL